MRWSKRAFDLLASALGLLILWPFFVTIALLIKLDDGGPVFFLQERVGYRGRPFRIWKFRTMVVDAERKGRLLTVSEDSRITRTGRWLRRSKLDELPQLINVVLGDMSLVGPRPEVEHYVALYTQEQWRVLELVPGITDPAAIRYRNESELLSAAGDPETAYVWSIMPEKIRQNLAYAAEATFWTDLRVIIETILGLPKP